MGNTHKPPSQLSVLKPLAANDRLEQVGKGSNFELVRVARLGQSSPIYEQYIIQRNPALSEQEDFQLYEARNGPQTGFVRVLNVQKTQIKDPTGKALLRVTTQRIPVRLAEIKTLTFEQALYVLKSALDTYRHIVSASKPVFITQRMIGVNTQGEVKVWVNENFSLNQPQYRDKPISEAEMVQLLFSFVANHISNGTFPIPFRTAYENTPHNFSDLTRFIDSYIQCNKLNIPRKLNLIPQPSKAVQYTQLPTNLSMQLSQKIPVSGLLTAQSANNSFTTVNKQSQVFFALRPGNSTARITTPNNNPKRSIEPTTPIQTIIRSESNIIQNRQFVPRVSVNTNQQSGFIGIPRPSHTGQLQQVVPSQLLPGRLPNGSIVESIVSASNVFPSQSIQTEVILHQTQQQIVNLPLGTRSVANSLPTSLVVEQRNSQRFEYPRRNFIDLRNAKVLAYATSEFIGQRERPDLSRNVIFVPADPQSKKNIGTVEKRNTLPAQGFRERRQLAKSMVVDRRTSRGRTTLYESRHRELRGAPIMHEGYDEFMRRMRTGQRPKSTLVRLSYGGRPGPTLHQKPAVFASEKIVTSQTTIEKSPKKKYISADPISINQFKQKLQEKSIRSIKLPIKKQVAVAGYERICFEQDLEPILKQPQQKKEVISRSPVKEVADQTPIKAMTTSVFSLTKTPTVVQNPQNILGKTNKPQAICNVKFNLVSPKGGQSVYFPPQQIHSSQLQPNGVILQSVQNYTKNIAVVKSSKENLQQQQVNTQPHGVRASQETGKATPTQKTSETNVAPSQSNLADQLKHPISMTSSDDFSSLRPETLFQPKPQHTKQEHFEPVYQPHSLQNQQMHQAQPVFHNFMNIGGIEVIENYGGQSSSHQVKQYGRYEESYEEHSVELPADEKLDYYSGAQQVEINYNKKEYEPIEYGHAEINQDYAEPVSKTHSLTSIRKQTQFLDPVESTSQSEKKYSTCVADEQQPTNGLRLLSIHITEESDNLDDIDNNKETKHIVNGKARTIMNQDTPVKGT